jgi:hypothetical protein
MLRPSAPPSPTWRVRFDRLDRAITTTLAAFAIPLLRIALGIVFVWFGALKLVPGLSPAENLAGRTIRLPNDPLGMKSWAGKSRS